MSTAIADSVSDAYGASLALDLRIQLLEALVGLNTPAARRGGSSEISIARRGQNVVRGVYQAVDGAGSEAVKRFLDSCMFISISLFLPLAIVLLHGY